MGYVRPIEVEGYFVLTDVTEAAVALVTQTWVPSRGHASG
jgi:hypothetical protein